MFFPVLYSFCSNPCGDDLTFLANYIPVPTVENPCPKPERRECCINKFAFLLCDEDAVPTSLTDPEAIQLLKDNNKMITFPDVGVTFNTPTEETFTKPCGETVVTRKTQLIDIDVYSVATDHSDELFWEDICNKNNKLAVIFQGKDNYTYIARDWIQAFIDEDAELPATQMGIPFTFKISPYQPPFVKGEPCRWKMQIEIEVECTLVSQYMPGFVGQM